MKEKNKIVVDVPVVFSAYGRVSVEVESVEELKKLLSDAEYLHSMPLPTDWYYLEDSFEIDKEYLEWAIQEAFEKGN